MIISDAREIGDRLDDDLRTELFEVMHDLLFMDTANLIETLRRVRQTMGDLKLLEADIVKAITEQRPAGPIDGESAEVTYSQKSVKWNRGAAKNAILQLERDIAVSEDSAVDPETGEKIPTWDQAVKVIDKYWLLGNPRTTPMKEAGIEPNEFRDSDGWNAGVKLT